MLQVFLILGLMAPLVAQAGVTEVGLTANYRTSGINDDNFQDSISYTGSISYYFWEMSAIELSYTQGLSRLSVKPSADDPTQVYKTQFELIGVDFVFTFAGRQAPLQPYVKLGAAHISKKIVREASDDGSQGTSEIESPAGIVPSAGVGFKLKLTKTFAFKVGVDAWTTEPITEDDDSDQKSALDYAGRAGFSWFF